MIVYTYVTGLNINGEPSLCMSQTEHCPKNWTLIDTREVHFNLGADEILKLAAEAQAEVDKMESDSE
jgi:hypothetical protein